MPHVRIVLEDDNGNSPPQTEQVYTLQNACDTLNRIEVAVETFKKQALPPLEQALLQEAQERCITKEKHTHCAVRATKLSRSRRCMAHSLFPNNAWC